MTVLRYTLVADGRSDRCLTHLLDWLFRQIPEARPVGIVPQVAEPGAFPEKAQDPSERVRFAVQQFPCDVLFIHRDSEAQPPALRREEIRVMTSKATLPIHVPVVPVRMTEAWLLIDEHAIRSAADNPNGRFGLRLPRQAELENIPDPKQVLESLLIDASEKAGRRRDQFKRDISARRQRVAELISDFSPLRKVPAFALLESDLNAAFSLWLKSQGLDSAQ